MTAEGENKKNTYNIFWHEITLKNYILNLCLSIPAINAIPPIDTIKNYV